MPTLVHLLTKMTVPSSCLLAILLMLCQSMVVSARWQPLPLNFVETSADHVRGPQDSVRSLEEDQRNLNEIKRSLELPGLPFLGGASDVIAQEDQLDKNPVDSSSSMSSRLTRRRRKVADSQPRWRSKLDEMIDKVRKRQWYAENGVETRFPLPERRKFPEVDWRGFNEDVFHESFGDFTPMKRSWLPPRASSKR